MNKAPFTHANLLVSGMVKTVNPGFERTIAFHIKHLQADKLAGGLSANILLHRVGKGLSP